MICPKCHHENPEDANFCSECGQELPDTAIFTDREANESHSLFYEFAHRINHAAGIRNPSEMKLRGLFSQVRRRHSNLEAERLFIVGTALTTPDIEEVADTWPRPWLFARVLFVAVLVYAGLYIGLNIFRNVNLLPGLIVTGSFMIPLCLLIFFWEMNAPQNVPIYKVIYMFFFGGILSLLTALMLYQGFQYRGEGSLVPGLVEELAKILIVIGFLRKRRFKYVLNGLLFGAAVGAGFAAFETAGYALRVVLTADLRTMYETILWRGILAPGGHIAWTALAGAAACMVKGDKPFKWIMLREPKFIRIFVVVVVIHALWDLPLFNIFALPVPQIVLALISWVLVLFMIKAGLKQIAGIKEQASHSEYVPGVLPSDTSSMVK